MNSGSTVSQSNNQNIENGNNTPGTDMNSKKTVMYEQYQNNNIFKRMIILNDIAGNASALQVRALVQSKCKCNN